MLTLLIALIAVAAGSGSTFNAQYWTKGARASPTATHSVLLGVQLKPGSLASCDSALMARSTPGNKLFGKHMSFKEVGSMFRNHKAEKAALSYLHKAGIKLSEMRKSPNGEFIRVTTTVAKLEKLLGAAYHEYAAVEDASAKVLRDLDYSLPAELKEFLDFCSDTYTLPVPPSLARNAIHYMDASASPQANQVTPPLLRSFYNIPDGPVANQGATQSLYESLGQSYEPSDLAAFLKQYNAVPTPIAKVVGTNSPSACQQNVNNCFEASLDVQQILALAQGATTWFWSIPNQGDIFLTWIEAVASTQDAPLVHSMSYASLAPEDPKYDIDRFNTELCKLGLKGLSLFVASGDDGVANFQARNNPSACGFTPSFPATSPYTTAVGGTQGPESGGPEIACSSKTGGGITTGGGFSTYVKRPDYQDAAVTAYLKNAPNLPPRSQFSSQGRAYPDVAMMAFNYPVLVGGTTYGGSGTSASTPVFASIISITNGQRLQAGKSAVGFLNPTLYSLGASGSNIFHDITKGENNCCAGAPASAVCCQYGFTATTGWDPVTGWGSVDAGKLISYLVSQ